MVTLDVIRLLLEATQRGKIRWKRSRANPDLFESSLAGEVLAVQFVRFARLDGGQPSRHMVELECFGVSTDFAVGTEAMDLINQMLAFNDLEWTAMRASIRERWQEAEATLHTLLEPAPAVLPSRKARPGAPGTVRVSKAKGKG